VVIFAVQQFLAINKVKKESEEQIEENAKEVKQEEAAADSASDISTAPSSEEYTTLSENEWDPASEEEEEDLKSAGGDNEAQKPPVANSGASLASESSSKAQASRRNPSGGLQPPRRPVTEDTTATFTKQEVPNRPRLGIDIGGVITKKRNDAASKGDNWTVDYEAPGALVGVKRLVEIFGAENVFLVSKLRLGGSMQRKTEHWLHDTMNFCERTGVIKEHIVFCSDISGPKGKGSVAEELGLSHFIDDKIEVLEAVFEDPTGNSGDLVRKHKGVLLLFAHGGDGLKPPKVYRSISDGLREHYKGVANWAQVLAQLDPGKTNLATRAALELLEPVLNPVRPKLQLRSVLTTFQPQVDLQVRHHRKQPRLITLGPPTARTSSATTGLRPASNDAV